MCNPINCCVTPFKFVNHLAKKDSYVAVSVALCALGIISMLGYFISTYSIGPVPLMIDETIGWFLYFSLLTLGLLILTTIMSTCNKAHQSATKIILSTQKG